MSSDCLYKEVNPKITCDINCYRFVNELDIKGVIEGLKKYEIRIKKERKFSGDDFKIEMEDVFHRYGYRQENKNKTEILIITDSGVGDFINLSASLREIRRIYENANISLVIYPRCKSLAEICPYIDKIYINTRNFDWNNFLSAYDWNMKFSLKLLTNRYDMAFVFGHYPSSYLLAYMSGAKDIVSYGVNNPICDIYPYANFYPALVNLITVKISPFIKSANAVDKYLGVLDNFIHVPVKNRKIETWVLPYENVEVEEFIYNKFGMVDDSCLIGIGVGGTSARKHWPPEKYVDFIKMILREDKNMRFIVLGGPEDNKEAEFIIKNLGSEKIFSFIGMNFRHSVAMIKKCAYYIGNDTSTMHIAAANNVPILNPNCYPLSLGLNDKSIPVVFAPKNVPLVIVLPKEALSECSNSNDIYGCSVIDRPHCICKIEPELMLEGFHLLKKLKDNDIITTKYIVENN